MDMNSLNSEDVACPIGPEQCHSGPIEFSLKDAGPVQPPVYME